LAANIRGANGWAARNAKTRKGGTARRSHKKHRSHRHVEEGQRCYLETAKTTKVHKRMRILRERRVHGFSSFLIP